MGILRLEQIHKGFGEGDVLRGIDLDVAAGEFLTLLGPSGCGKTTTLRIIAGLEKPDSGRVLLGGNDVTALPPEKRGVNTVFQNYALFPHMNVAQNIGYGLKIRGFNRQDAARKVAEMLRLVQLEGYDRRMPDSLSGGQRQRVAIARAVVLAPQVLLLDEPLGALDLQLRRQMQTELKTLQEALGITFIYITHDQEEALNMSNRIAVMREGQFEQIGAPEEIYEHPATRFAAAFIGQTNLLEATVTARDGARLTLSYHGETLPAEGASAPGTQVALCLRTERVHFGPDVPEGHWSIPATLLEYRFAGGSLRTLLELPGGQKIVAFTGKRPDVEPGETVRVWWNERHVAVIE